MHAQMSDAAEGRMTESTKGLIAMCVCYTVWGLSPLYYAQLKHVPPLEVLSYRCLWSLLFFTVVLLVQKRLPLVFATLSKPRNLIIIATAAIMISTNWFGFIFAVSTGQGLEASLGYYIFPLVAVLLGRVLFGERLSKTQTMAVTVATVAVLLLAVGLGAPLYIGLTLAISFGVYGLIKKQLDVGPVVSVTAEVLLLSPLALIWIMMNGTGGVAGHSTGTQVLMAISGPLTALPLVLFSYAARRSRMSTIGIVQYMNPTLQFLCAVLVFAEPFTPWHAVAFPMIWGALTLYSWSSLSQDRAARRLVSSAGTSSTTVT